MPSDRRSPRRSSNICNEGSPQKETLPCKTAANNVSGFVTTSWDEELAALRIKWFSEYAEGSGVTDAVELAIDYVDEHI